MKKKTRKIVYPVLLLFTLYLAGGLVLAKRQDQIIYRPETLDSGYHFKTRFTYKEFYIPVNATEKLNILYLYTDSAKGQILYFHDNSGNISTHLELLSFFIKNKYNVFIIDYPGYGKSTGTPSEKSLNESAEILYELAGKYASPDSTILYGKGLGAAVAAYLASRHPCKTLVLVSPFYSLYAIAHHYFPVYRIKKYLDAQYPVYHYVERTAAPVILFHGEKDHVIPFSQSEKLSKILYKKDRFIALPHASHNNVTEQQEYQKVMKALLNE